MATDDLQYALTSVCWVCLGWSCRLPEHLLQSSGISSCGKHMYLSPNTSGMASKVRVMVLASAIHSLHNSF
jgi:hypothetical protein